MEVAIAALTMAGVITVGVLRVLLLAVALSVVDAVRRGTTADDAVLGWVERLDRHADVRLHPTATIVPGVLIYRLDDRSAVADDTSEADVAHARVDHLRPSCGWTVTHAVTICRQVRTALDHLARHPELGLPFIEAVLDCAASRIARDTAGLVDLIRVTVGVPVGVQSQTFPAMS